MTILKVLATYPALFDALTLKLNVPAVVGVPVIAPVVEAKSKPDGRLPLSIAHVIGVGPLATNLWL